MPIIVNPETKTLHVDPGEKCNTDDARRDPGPKPYPIEGKKALRALLADGFEWCGHCIGD